MATHILAHLIPRDFVYYSSGISPNGIHYEVYNRGGNLFCFSTETEGLFEGLSNVELIGILDNNQFLPIDTTQISELFCVDQDESDGCYTCFSFVKKQPILSRENGNAHYLIDDDSESFEFVTVQAADSPIDVSSRISDITNDEIWAESDDASNDDFIFVVVDFGDISSL